MKVEVTWKLAKVNYLLWKPSLNRFFKGNWSSSPSFMSCYQDCYDLSSHDDHDHWSVNILSSIASAMIALVLVGSISRCQKHCCKSAMSFVKAEVGVSSLNKLPLSVQFRLRTIRSQDVLRLTSFVRITPIIGRQCSISWEFIVITFL